MNRNGLQIQWDSTGKIKGTEIEKYYFNDKTTVLPNNEISPLKFLELREQLPSL